MSERTDTAHTPTADQAEGADAVGTTNTITGSTGGTVVPMRPRGGEQSKPERPTLDRLWREVLGEEMRRHRTARKERLRDTADRAGISPQYLSELERGMKDPSSEMLEAVAGALGKSSFELTRSAIRAWGSQGSRGAASPATNAGGAVLMCAA